MYDRTIEDKTYTFGVSGKLIRNVLVMFDWETESLWSQLLGKAVEGPLAGTSAFWFGWKDFYPQTLVYGQAS